MVHNRKVRDLLALRQLRPCPAAADAGRLFRDDVRTRTSGLVPDLDQDPTLGTGPGQREAAGQLAAVQDEGHVSRLVADHVGGSLVPDDYRAGPAPLPVVDTLKVPRGQGMILDRYR